MSQLKSCRLSPRFFLFVLIFFSVSFKAEAFLDFDDGQGTRFDNQRKRIADDHNYYKRLMSEHDETLSELDRHLSNYLEDINFLDNEISSFETILFEQQQRYHMLSHLDVRSWIKNNVEYVRKNLKKEYLKVSKPTLSHLKGIKELSLGWGHSLLLTEDAKVYSWGWNERGQLGLGDTQNRFSPSLVTALEDKNITQISSYEDHSFALDKNGEVYAWGDNIYGQLGLENREDSLTKDTTRMTPEKIHFPPGATIRKIFVSLYHTFALSEDGKVYSWGLNIGQIGLGNRDYIPTPSLVTALEDKNITQISSLPQHTLALDDKGNVYGWGANKFGRLGFSDGIDRNEPNLIKDFKNNNIVIKDIIASHDHSLALDDKGNVYGWGFNEKGQLGLGDNENRNTPTGIPYFKDKGIRITKLSIGNWHSLALDDKGHVFTWGDNEKGQLGLGDNENRNTPTVIPYFKDKGIRITKLLIGNWHSLALDDKGHVFTWGDNEKGQLGLGDIIYKNTPTLLSDFKDKKITDISVGDNHNIARTEEGEIYVWGWNEYGQLGLVSPEVQRILAESQDIIHKHDISDYQESGGYKISNNVLKIFEDPHNKLTHIQGGDFSHNKIEITGGTIHLSDLSLTARDVIKIRLTGKEGQISLANCKIKTPRLVILAKDQSVTIEKSYFDIEKSFELRLSQKEKRDTSVWSKLLPTYLYGPIANLNIDESTEIVIDGRPYKSFDDMDNNLHLIKKGEEILNILSHKNEDNEPSKGNDEGKREL